MANYIGLMGKGGKYDVLYVVNVLSGIQQEKV